VSLEDIVSLVAERTGQLTAYLLPNVLHYADAVCQDHLFCTKHLSPLEELQGEHQTQSSNRQWISWEAAIAILADAVTQELNERR
jgi:hypothetical protein